MWLYQTRQAHILAAFIRPGTLTRNLQAPFRIYAASIRTHSSVQHKNGAHQVSYIGETPIGIFCPYGGMMLVTRILFLDKNRQCEND